MLKTPTSLSHCNKTIIQIETLLKENQELKNYIQKYIPQTAQVPAYTKSEANKNTS